MCSRSSSSVGEGAQSLELLEEKDDHDEVLGSCLELELNLSIKKMREEEDSSPIAHHTRPEDSIVSSSKGVGSSKDSTTSSPQHEGESPTTPNNCTMELLEDIEMPNLSISQCESSDLISVSSASLNSPVKFSDHCKSEISSGSSFMVSEIKKSAKLKEASSLYITGEPDTKEMDVYEKVAFLSTPLTACVKTLVSVDEIDPVSDKEVDRKSRCNEVLAAETHGVEPEVEDTTTNVTSSPITSPDLQMTLGTGLELLDIDNMNDSLLTSSVLANYSVNEKNNGTFTHSRPPALHKKVCYTDPVEEKKELSESETSYSSGFLAEACSIMSQLQNMTASMTSSSLTSPDHQMTINPLDLEAINDSLLNSSSLANSPSKKTHLQDAFISPLRPPVAGKETPESKCEMTTSNGNVKMNYCTFDGSAKLVNETDNDTDVFAAKMTKWQEDKNHFEVIVSSNYEKPKQCLNSTFNHKKKWQCMNTTFDQMSIRPAFNSTFDIQLENSANIPLDGKTTNTTFIQTSKCVNRTFDGKVLENAKPSSQFLNATFEKKEDEPTNTTFVTKSTSEATENKLNVTFEQGEYKIQSLNETVNLMDAEGEVLQLILDSTPQKASKTTNEAASTPKCGDKSRQLLSKRTLPKDPTQSFLRRISLGVRRDSQSQAHQENKCSSSQDTNARPIIKGLRIDSVDHQAVASQLRRLHSGASSVRSGPMRALPLQTTSGACFNEKSQESLGTPDSLKGMKGLTHNIPRDSDVGGCTQHGGRPAAPSFGSVSSIESERPGTPDIGIITGIGLSTPDVFRNKDLTTGPRITSTPTMRVGVFSCIVGIEGQAPTPITAPPSRSRVVSISSTASLPEGRCNDSLVWQGYSQESVKDSRRTASNSDNSASGMSKQISHNRKLTPDNLDSDISVGIAEMPQVRVQSSGTGGVYTEAVNVQGNYENICDQKRVNIEIEELDRDIVNQETAEVSNKITHKKNATQTVWEDIDSCPQSLITGEGKQNLAAVIRSEYQLKSDFHINTHNSNSQMNCHPKSIASDDQKASVSDDDRFQLSNDVIEKEKFTTHLESKIDTRVDFITKEKATSSVETRLVSNLNDEYESQADNVERQQHKNSTVASEQKLEFTSDEKNLLQTRNDEKQQVETSVENQLVENSVVEKEKVKTSDGEVHQMEASVHENQQVKTTVSKEVESCRVENQQVKTIVGENQLVMTIVGEKQQVDEKQVESIIGEKQQVDTNVVRSQSLQDCSDVKMHLKKSKKSHLVSDVKTNQVEGTRKIQNNLKVCRGIHKEINMMNRQHSIASGNLSSSLVQKCSTVSTSVVKDKLDVKGRPSRRHSHSHVGMKHTLSTSGAQGGPDKKNISDSSLALKVNSGKVVASKKTNSILRKSISNIDKPLQSSIRSVDKDDKENKRKSNVISSKQSTTQVKSRVSVLPGKKTPFTRPVLGSSNFGARSSVAQPVALRSTFSAGKVPLKTNTSLRPSKANSVALKITGEVKKAKGFSTESQNISPKFPSALKQPIDSSLPENHQSSRRKPGKTMSKVESSVGLKMPVAVRHQSKSSDTNHQGDPTTESHVENKLSRRSTDIAPPVASRKPSFLRAPKTRVR